jgi:hypothetical protein
MARKSKMAVLKRQRELKKSEKAALKREKRRLRSEAESQTLESQVPTKEDLEDYGFSPDPDGRNS